MQTKAMKTKTMKTKVQSFLLTLAILLFSFPSGVFAAPYADMPGTDTWSYTAIQAAVENGWLQGNNGKLNLSGNLTRAQMAAVFNRVLGAVHMANLDAYTDLNTDAWYFSDMGKAVRLGILQGSGTKMRPNDSVTREEAFTVLARVLKLEENNLDALNKFSDSKSVSSWAAASAAALLNAGYIQGSDGRLRPAEIMTREAFAQMMYNAFPNCLSKADTYTMSLAGNVLINTQDVVLKGLKIAGDLIIGEGVDNGDVVLDGVTVTGRVIVRGGGENSIRLINQTNVGSIVVGKTGDGGVRVRTEEGCRVDVLYIDDGLDDIILEGVFNQVEVATDAPVTIQDAVVTGLTLSGGSAKVKLGGNTQVSVTQITEQAAGSSLDVGSGAKVVKLESAAANVSVEGQGTVTQAVVSGSHTSVNTAGTRVTAAEGTEGVTRNGQSVQPGTSSGPATTAPETPVSSDKKPNNPPQQTTANASTLQQLQDALTDSTVSAIHITGNILVPAGTTVVMNKPVTVAAQSSASLEVKGTVTGSAVFTLASMQGDAGLKISDNGRFNSSSEFHAGRGILLKDQGYLQIDPGCPMNIVENGYLLVDDAGCTINIQGGIANECYFGCKGTMNVEGDFSNSGFAFCSGSFTCAESGHVQNAGMFCNYGALSVESNGVFENTAELVLNGTETGTLTDEGGDAHRETRLAVQSFSDLKTAMSTLDTASYSGVTILADIELTESLDIVQHTDIAPFALLDIPSPYQLTIAPEQQLRAFGRLRLGGALEVAVDGNDNHRFGVVLIQDGQLVAYGDQGVIQNNGMIRANEWATVDLDGLQHFNGNGIEFPQTVVTTEAELREAIEHPTGREISMRDDITLTSDLQVTEPVIVEYNHDASTPYSLTVSSGVTLSIAAGGDNQTRVFGSLINHGTLNIEQSGRLLFVGGVLDNQADGNVSGDGEMSLEPDMWEGSSITERSSQLLNAGVFNLSGMLDLSSDEDANTRTVLSNTGTFNLGPVSQSSSSAHVGMMHAILNNSGAFVNNGQLDMTDTSFAHQNGTFDNYNNAGVTWVGGTLDISGAPSGTFRNNGFIQVCDEYGKSAGTNYRCTIAFGDKELGNNSNWLEYSANVYSESGLGDLDTAQTAKAATAPDAKKEYLCGLKVYNHVNFVRDIQLTSDTTFKQNLQSYWIGSYWDGENGQEKQVTLTVGSGVALTVENGCTLYVQTGTFNNEGTLTIESDGDVSGVYFPGGTADIMVEGTFHTTGSVVNNGNFVVRYLDDGNGNFARSGAVTGTLPANATLLADVRSEAGLVAAAGATGPAYTRIEIRENSNFDLSQNLQITDKEIAIEPGSGFSILADATLTLSGASIILENGGDLSVFGTLAAVSGFTVHNNQNIGIGSVSGAQTGAMTISAGSSLINDKDIVLYVNGVLDNEGVVENHAKSTITNAGTITNKSGGSISNDSEGVLVNNGVIANDGTLSLSADSTFTNNGTITGNQPVTP